MNGMVTCDVTFDGSWHKRGHRSNFGVGAAVEVVTGLIFRLCGVFKSMFHVQQKTKSHGKTGK